MLLLPLNARSAVKRCPAERKLARVAERMKGPVGMKTRLAMMGSIFRMKLMTTSNHVMRLLKVNLFKALSSW